MNQDIHAQFANQGLVLEGAPEIGKLKRCKVEGDRGRKESGWYVLHELVLNNGNQVLVGRFGNWKNGTGYDGVPVEFEARDLDDEERARMKAAQDQARAKAAEEREARARNAASRAADIWAKLPDSGTSDYLKRKGVKAWGLRFSRGSVVVPVRNIAGDLVGLQFIDAGGEKTFLTGTAKRGAFHLIGEAPEDLPDNVLAVAEGYATAATIHEAMGFPCVVAFDAGNLKPVVQAIRGKFPALRILVCSDFDRYTTPAWGCLDCGWLVLRRFGDRDNPRYAEPAICPKCASDQCGHGGPGEIAAWSAARSVSNAAAALPVFDREHAA